MHRRVHQRQEQQQEQARKAGCRWTAIVQQSVGASDDHGSRSSGSSSRRKSTLAADTQLC